jgi:tetratricopeptide (TPR) repeat protein
VWKFAGELKSFPEEEDMKTVKIISLCAICLGIVVVLIFLLNRGDEKTKQLVREGNAYLEKGTLDKAEASYKEALKISPKSSEAHAGLAKTYSQQGKIEEAIKEYLEAVKHDQSNHEAHYLLSALYFNNFMYEEALKEIEKAVKLSPQNMDYRSFAAQMYDRTKRYSQAIQEWEIVLKATKREARYLVPLAGAYYRNGETEKSIELLKEASQAEPNSQFGIMASSLLKDIETKHGNEIRLKNLKQELDFSPNNPDVYFEMAKIYFDDEKYADAEERLKKAIAIRADKSEYFILLSKAQDKMNNKTEAVKNLEEAAKISPKDHSLLLSLAGLYFQVGRIPEATEKLREVISLAPQSEEAKFAEAKIKEIEELKKKEGK